MNWRDYLYFSKGERRALTLLLCLITISCILLFWTEQKRMPIASEADAYRTEKQSASDEKRIIIGKDTLERETNSTRKEPQPSPNKKSYPVEKRRKEYKPYIRTEKYRAGTLVELNSADTTILKKVPGIGSTFARRIVKYRNLLGGFHSVGQLAEVYGIDQERYQALAPWFIADTLRLRKLNVNKLSSSDLRKHPYIDYRQAKVIEQLRNQKSRLSGWENLLLIEEFTKEDRLRLSPYLSFE